MIIFFFNVNFTDVRQSSVLIGFMGRDYLPSLCICGAQPIIAKKYGLGWYPIASGRNSVPATVCFMSISFEYLELITSQYKNLSCHQYAEERETSWEVRVLQKGHLS